MRASRSGLGDVLLLALVGLSAACSPPPSHVAQGESFSTGNATFDDFFSAVREVRTQALSARDDAEGAHAGLVTALGIEAKAKTSLTLDEAGARAKKLQEKGVLLHLEIAPEPKFVTVHGKADVGPENEALLKAMEGAVRSSLETRKRLASVAAHAAELEKRRAELRDQAPTAFHEEKQPKRDEIIAELDASKAVLADAGEGASRAAGAASRFVVELVQVVETGGGVTPEVPRPAGPRKKGQPGPRVASPAAKGPPVAAPAPAKKKKGGDDFEP
jgi:hypothetical protein